MGLSSIADYSVPATPLWVEVKVQDEKARPYRFKHIWSGRSPKVAMKEAIKKFQDMSFEVVGIEFIRSNTPPRTGHEIGLRLILRPGSGRHLVLEGDGEEWDKHIWARGEKDEAQKGPRQN